MSPQKGGGFAASGKKQPSKSRLNKSPSRPTADGPKF